MKKCKLYIITKKINHFNYLIKNDVNYYSNTYTFYNYKLQISKYLKIKPNYIDGALRACHGVS